MKNYQSNGNYGWNRIFNVEIKKSIYIDISLDKLDVETMEDGKTGSFEGSFKTNIILPNLIGVGNGITKGYGVITSNVNYPEFCDFLDDNEKKISSEKLPEDWESKSISPSDIPLSLSLIHISEPTRPY